MSTTGSGWGAEGDWGDGAAVPWRDLGLVGSGCVWGGDVRSLPHIRLGEARGGLLDFGEFPSHL